MRRIFSGALCLCVGAALFLSGAGGAAAQGIDHRIRAEGALRVTTKLDPAAEQVSSPKIVDGKYLAGTSLKEVSKLEEETLSGGTVPEEKVIFVQPVLDEIERRENRKKKKVF